MKYFLNQQRKFVFGSLVYQYQLVSQERKTLSLTVTPSGGIIVKAPFKSDDERINLFLKRKWFWLEKQITYFGKFRSKVHVKEYLTGESIFYLGKQYKLIVKKGSGDRVSLSKGVLVVDTTRSVSDSRYTKKLVDKWFAKKIEDVFQDRFTEMKNRFDYKKMPTLGIREMKRRWGSFLDKKQIVLNPKLIHVPKECIDYVIVHELCHYRFSRHDKRFFAFFDEQYPKRKKVKERLELIGDLVR